MIFTEFHNKYFAIYISVPLYVIAITETQFISCLQLIRNRLKLINDELNKIEKSVTSERNDYNGNSCGSNYAKKIRLVKNTSFTNRAMKNNGKSVKSIFIIRTLNEKTGKNSTSLPINCASPSTHFKHDDEISDKIIQFHRIYTKLECVKAVVNSVYSLHLIIILITKFTTLTSLLYFCSMIIIKWVL